MNKLKQCILCQNKRSEIYIPFSSDWKKSLSSLKYYSATDDGFNIHSTILKCQNCGLVYINEHLNKTKLINSYKNQKDEIYPTQIKERNKTNKLYLKYIQKFISKGKLLEIGSYYGFFLQNVQKAGYDVLGIEPNKIAASYSKKKFNLNIMNKNIESVNLSSKFDVIVLFDIIEHFYDPVNVIKKIHCWLKKDGLLIFTTPDVESIFSKMQGKRWYAYRQQHLYYFSKKSIIELFKITGFELVFYKHLAHYFTIGYLLHQMKFSLYKIVRLFGLDKMIIKINLFDHIFVCAKKISST